ncbi:DUF5815 family protein [Halorhabdus rudnickae]|uniref:DUF5815 family protein n=1 Tax=Halorhabdus rudnickae TaxID=1775544 RepID=UPI001082CA8D|nr:DUF5815 family protein [Halorhabdus rudnickae]
MSTPRVPGSGDRIELPCGESIGLSELDMGMREFDCGCESTHAIVMDVHPPARFLPEFLVDVLRETVETTDEAEQLGTAHLMGIVLEEFPDAVVAEDVEDDGDIGCGLVWVTDFDARRLHEIIIELVVDLMEHAVSHADDDEAIANFESEMREFDVGKFVEVYRSERDFEGEHDTAV